MKKQIATIAISTFLAFCLAGCGSSGAASSSSSSDTAAASDTDSAPTASGTTITAASALGGDTAAGDSYDGFVEEYTYRMELETPVLIDEYNSQSASMGNDTQAKVDLRDEKIAELDKIRSEGIGKMEALMYQNSGDSSMFDESVEKLNEAFNTQAAVITNATIASR